MKYKIFQILSILIIFGGLLSLCWQAIRNPKIFDIGGVGQKIKSIGNEFLPSTNNATETKIPDSAQIAGVPFVPQAPFAIWDQLHEEACEEMAVILVDHFLTKKPIDKVIAENELQAMVAWQVHKWGKQHDLTIEETVKFLAKEYLGYQNIRYKYNISIEDIKREIADGNPVITPMAGRILANPFYTPPGPLYHYVVITGYTPNEFIVHDIGVWQGENWHYKIDHFWEALHDWNGGNVTVGPKAMMVIEKS